MSYGRVNDFGGRGRSSNRASQKGKPQSRKNLGGFAIRA